jgi:hypothetical protein
MIAARRIGLLVRIIEVLQTQKRLAGAKRRRVQKAVQDPSSIDIILKKQQLETAPWFQRPTRVLLIII